MLLRSESQKASSAGTVNRRTLGVIRRCSQWVERTHHLGQESAEELPALTPTFGGGSRLRAAAARTRRGKRAAEARFG